jgi:hypothetical protein
MEKVKIVVREETLELDVDDFEAWLEHAVVCDYVRDARC